MRLQDRAARVLVQSLIYHVEIFIQRGTNEGHSRSLLTGLVETALWSQGVDLLVTFEDIEDGPFARVVGKIFVSIRAADQRVAADRHLVAVSHLLLFVLIESGSGESDDYDHHTEVNDVSAVTARVAMRELHHRREHALAGVSSDDFATAVVLAGDGEGDERREADGHQRVEI